jgi:hypothetical protein
MPVKCEDMTIAPCLRPYNSNGMPPRDCESPGARSTPSREVPTMGSVAHSARGQSIFAIGTEFGRLVVVGRPYLERRGSKRRSFYPCRCSCGVERSIRQDILKGGAESCGCARDEAALAVLVTHGESRTRLYVIRNGMIQRCHNPANPRFFDYGGRGIQVCQLWRYDYEAFRDWAHAHGYRADLEIERTDNDGPYSPGNCRWATRGEQARNTRQNRIYTAFGETKCAFDWARDPRCKVPHTTLRNRLTRGWTFVDALTTPPLPPRYYERRPAAS